MVSLRDEDRDRWNLFSMHKPQLYKRPDTRDLARCGAALRLGVAPPRPGDSPSIHPPTLSSPTPSNLSIKTSGAGPGDQSPYLPKVPLPTHSQSGSRGLPLGVSGLTHLGFRLPTPRPAPLVLLITAPPPGLRPGPPHSRAPSRTAPAGCGRRSRSLGKYRPRPPPRSRP